METLFIHYPTNVKEKIMFKDFGGANNDFTVEMLFLKYLVYVRPVTMHLFGKPFDRPTLFIENRFDNMSHMKIRHPPCIKLYRELLFEVEVLAYPLSQQESPRYIYT